MFTADETKCKGNFISVCCQSGYNSPSLQAGQTENIMKKTKLNRWKFYIKDEIVNVSDVK